MGSRQARILEVSENAVPLCLTDVPGLLIEVLARRALEAIHHVVEMEFRLDDCVVLRGKSRGSGQW